MPDWVTVLAPWRRAVLLLALFCACGAMAGVLWESVWEPPAGVALAGEWYFNPAGPDTAFSATALYVAIAMPVGTLLGLAIGLMNRRELQTVLVVLVASSLAGIVMCTVGSSLGPADPRALAREAEDYASVPAALELNPEKGEPAWASTALVAMPAGAMAGLSAMLLLAGGRTRQHSR